MTIRIAFTPGEPAGIGPDLAVLIAQRGSPYEIVAYADPQLLKERAKLLGLPLTLRQPTTPPTPLPQGELAIAVIPCQQKTVPGLLNPLNSRYVLNCLKRATSDCQSGHCQALVTGPVHKGVINDSGITFSGHTEYLAEQTSTPLVVMMLASENLRVALTTTHLPLSDVPAAITRPLLTEIIEILHRDLIEKFSIARPKILVCGLNPHAGEGGHMGREEIDVIEPAIKSLQKKNINLIGPLAADTLFTPKYLDQADAVLAMYHDQGLPVLKYQGFGKAVNITLGLPIIRTSVDHGTALELAGTKNVDCGSLQTALEYAVNMVRSRHS